MTSKDVKYYEPIFLMQVAAANIHHCLYKVKNVELSSVLTVESAENVM